jgi:hypothetical protein
MTVAGVLITDKIRVPGVAAIRIWQAAFLACFLVGISVVLFLISGLDQFSDRAIGVAVIKNTDLYYRIYFYIFALVAAIALATCVFLGGSLEREKASARIDEPLVWLLGACALLNLLSAFVEGSSALFLKGGLLAFLLLLLWLGYSRFSKETSKDAGFLRNVCVSWQGVSILYLLFAWQFGTFFWVAWVVIFGLVVSVQKLFDRPISSPAMTLGRPAFQVFTLWLATSPLLYIAANEMAYFSALHGQPSLTPPAVFVLLSAAVASVALIRRHRLPASVGIYALCVLMSTIVLNEYRSEIVYRQSYDVFHLGEKIIPLQQWISFGLLPFVDYLPTHGLADAAPQALYQWLSGGPLLESVIWGNGHFMGWLPRAFAILLLYLCLAKLIKPVTAFFLLWLLPTYHVFEPYYTLLLLPAIHLLNFQHYRSQNAWWLIQWLLTAALFLWRLDFGIAAIGGNIGIAILASWYYSSIGILVRCLLVGAIISAVGFAIFYLLCQGQDIYTNLELIKAYILNQVLITSYEEFYKEFNYAVVMQLAILPILSALIFAYTLSFIIRKRSWTQKLPVDLLIIFFSAISFILSVRSLQRHSLEDGDFNNYLYVFTMLLFLIRHFPLPRLLFAPVVLAIFVVVSHWALPTAQNFYVRSIYHPGVTKEYPIATTGNFLPRWQTDTVRLENQIKSYDDFLAFMAQSLKPGESFYDFANAPLLYPLADVELPIYFPQTLYQTADTVQRQTVERLDSWYRKKKLPFVVFRQNNILDEMDGVDTALRSYRIAEYLYKNYIPCLRADNFDLWVDRRMASSRECENKLQDLLSLDPDLRDRLEPLAPDYLQQHIAFYALPYIWANEDSIKEAELETRELSIEGGHAGQWIVHSVGKPLGCGENPCYLDLVIASENEQEVAVSFLSKEQLSFTLRPGEHRYRLRMSLLWHWYNAEIIPTLELEGGSPMQLSSARIVVLEKG